ncbi:hypothetical protein [Haloferula sp.]|uniref:hypothetical protein n=1 Tax=Haloferula sp. TaxID=2497595 RepID=UPI00329B1B5C
MLHGWDDDFEGELSDIDYVIDRGSFGNLPEIVESYCRRSGWRMCQVLRHETTAAFCVCSSIADPSMVVALDACSDYRRNGTLLMGSEELLGSRQALPWGGFRLSDRTELKYRFIKAAAKRKPVDEIGSELAAYDLEVRGACVDWLLNNWQVEMEGWSMPQIGRSLESLFEKTRKPVGFLGFSSMTRIVDRVLRPSGLVVICGERLSEPVVDRLHEVFRGLYFRRGERRRGMGLKGLVSVVRSTFITVPRLNGAVRRFLGRGVVLDLASENDSDSVLAVADHLHVRCLKREGVEV